MSYAQVKVPARLEIGTECVGKFNFLGSAAHVRVVVVTHLHIHGHMHLRIIKLDHEHTSYKWSVPHYNNI